MNLQSLYYFSELAKTLHMTQTAERLFISQQNLSNHIQRLENYYGVKLFERKPRLQLTYAGEQVLEFANMINRESINLTNILSEIKNEATGTIRFGGSPLRINAILPYVLSEFTQQFPHVEIRISDVLSKELENKVLNYEVDFAVVTGHEPHPELIDVPLMEDPLYLCVSKKLLEKHLPDTYEMIIKKSANGTDLKDFADIPFCILENRLGKMIDQVFKDASVMPKVYSTSILTQISTAIGLKGHAACFVPHLGLANIIDRLPPDMYIFPVLYKGKVLVQTVNLICRANQYHPAFEKLFMELLKKRYQEIAELKMK